MKKSRYSVPKGYKGIANNINLEFNTNLAVITGLNGSGKSTILKYLYENYSDRSKCFIKTLQNNDFQNGDRRKLIGSNSNDEISLENIIKEIESIGLRRRGRVNSPFLDKTDFYSALFDVGSIYYANGYLYLEGIANLLADYQFDDLDNIKKELGIPTSHQIDKKLITELNKNKVNNSTIFEIQKGGNILEKFYALGFNEVQREIINKMRKKIEDDLKIELRKKSKISSEHTLKKYIYDLITKEFRSIESIVQKMSNKIFQDFKSKSSKTKTKKLWEEINEELEKYCKNGHFKYVLVPPQSFESNYEIAFDRYDKPLKNYIHFDSLSSGEKIIFELICYYFAAKESKLELIMLDEFDANLNPQLAEMYIYVIKEQFKNINVVLTTHSPSTVVEVEPKELFELTDSRELKCANDENGKREILKRLAPKFVYHGEFGILEDVFNTKYDMIVFLEGNNDVKNFESIKGDDRIKFIDSNGCGNMPNLVRIFKAIPFFKNLANQKQIAFLFDFDKDGFEKLAECISDKQFNSQCIYDTIRNKEAFCYKMEDLNIFVSHLIPAQKHSWQISDVFRHQELKIEGIDGIHRQFDHLKKIKDGFHNLIEAQ